MKTHLVLILIAATASLLVATAASADRTIVVNGQTLSREQISILDSAACTRVPTGRYWLLPNGAWGYEGFPIVAGFVGDQCIRAQAPATPSPAPRRKSLSERGLLYSPGEILSR